MSLSKVISVVVNHHEISQRLTN